MTIKKYELDALELPKVHPLARPASRQLKVAHTTLQGVFESLHVVRENTRGEKDSRGRLNEGEVDLLRSSIVLAGAGLEAVLKRLVSDALPGLLGTPRKNSGAVRKYKEYVRGQFQDRGATGAWIEAIISEDPRPQMTSLYIDALISRSIQSETELRAVRDALGIDEEQVPNDRIAGVRGFLSARNQVAHDLDLKKPKDESRGQRYQRTIPKVLGHCNEAVSLTSCYVLCVSDLLRQRKGKE